MADIDKCCIQTGHQFFNLPEEDIPYIKLGIGLLLVKFDQLFVFKQSNLYRTLLGRDNEFFFHASIYMMRSLS